MPHDICPDRCREREADWIAFDDEPFVENDPRLMHVDFELGIDYNLFVKACEHWNISLKAMII